MEEGIRQTGKLPPAHFCLGSIGSVDSRRTDGRRTVVQPDVRAAPVSSAAPKKNHLIEAASFGRLDQMLRTAVQEGTYPTMTLSPPPLPDQPGGIRLLTKNMT